MISYILIDILQFSPVFIVILQRLNRPVERFESASLSELVVARNSVITSALEVERQQILTEIFAFAEIWG